MWGVKVKRHDHNKFISIDFVTYAMGFRFVCQNTSIEKWVMYYPFLIIFCILYPQNNYLKHSLPRGYVFMNKCHMQWLSNECKIKFASTWWLRMSMLFLSMCPSKRIITTFNLAVNIVHREGVLFWGGIFWVKRRAQKPLPLN